MLSSQATRSHGIVRYFSTKLCIVTAYFGIYLPSYTESSFNLIHIWHVTLQKTLIFLTFIFEISISAQEGNGSHYLPNVHVTHSKSINISPYLPRFVMCRSTHSRHMLAEFRTWLFKRKVTYANKLLMHVRLRGYCQLSVLMFLAVENLVSVPRKHRETNTWNL
jgi:hypothetical protein